MAERFREIFTPKELYLIHEAFHAGIASVTDFTAQPSTQKLLEEWLNASVTENGEFVVADLLKVEYDKFDE